MLKTIWKFPLKITDEQVVEMPEGAQILSIQAQQNELCIWAMVTPDAVKMKRTFVVKGTGHPIDNARQLNFVATAQTAGGALVWHVFEKKDFDIRSH